jgi:hypothetical protein
MSAIALSSRGSIDGTGGLVERKVSGQRGRHGPGVRGDASRPAYRARVW